MYPEPTTYVSKTFSGPNSGTSCKICLKAFKPEDTRKTCAKCRFSICESCCSRYYLETTNEKPGNWKCNVCSRKFKSFSGAGRSFSRELVDIPEESLVEVNSKGQPNDNNNKEVGGHHEASSGESALCSSTPKEVPHGIPLDVLLKTEPGDPTTMPRKALAGYAYHEATNLEAANYSGPKIEPLTDVEAEGDAAEEEQQCSQWGETSRRRPFDTLWLTFDEYDLNAVLRRLLIHTKDTVPHSPSLITVFIRRDLTDRSPTTRGLGMHVTGGRVGTFIYWIEPGGRAERAGAEEGDWILQWNTSSLIDRTFEEVLWIIGDMDPVVKLLIRRSPEGKEKKLPLLGAMRYDDSDPDERPSTSYGRKSST